jgi:hypothetical protein
MCRTKPEEFLNAFKYCKWLLVGFFLENLKKLSNYDNFSIKNMLMFRCSFLTIPSVVRRLPMTNQPLARKLRSKNMGSSINSKKSIFFYVTSFMDDPYLAEKWCFSDFGILKTNIDTKFRYI